MLNTRWFVLISGLIVSTGSALALRPEKALSQYTRTNWTTAEGLPADVIRRMAQTTDGMLWIGTDEGLARFDGYEFTVFGRTNSALPSNFITALSGAHDGSLWIGTPEGLIHYEHRGFRVWGEREGLPDPNVSMLYEDRNATLWVVSGNRLCTIRNGKLEVIPREKLMPVEAPHTFFEDQQGRIWITGAGGVVRSEGNGFVPVLGPAEMEGLTGHALALDRAGTLWVGSDRGVLARTSAGVIHRYDAPGQIPNPLVHALLVDRDGVLWVGTNGGLARWEQDHFVPQDVSQVHNRLVVGCLLEDREGNLWVGSGIGILRFRDDRFTSFGQPEGWPADTPSSVLEDGQGTLWVGYHDSGLLRVAATRGSARSERLYTIRDGLSSDGILAVRQARNGDLLIATRAGLSRMHNGHFETTVLPDSMERRQIFDVAEDSHGRLLVATPVGVRVQDGTQWRTIISTTSSSERPVALSEGIHGEIWVGTYNAGMWKIESGGAVRHFTRGDGLSSSQIRSFFPDENGVLWIGTYGGGLVRFDGQHFRAFTTHDGLPSDNVAHIDYDGMGDFWLSTAHGIARVSRKALESGSRFPVAVYGLEDGLRTLHIGPSPAGAPGGTRTRDGRLWFTTSVSLSMTDPRMPDPGELRPAASLVEITAAGKGLNPEQEARVQPGAGQIQMRFTGVHLRAPERVRYQYLLEGLDNKWSASSTQRSITYNGLPHGSYTFHVRAMLPGQAPSETSFAFLVLPRFYETAWFLCGCLALLGAAAYGAYRLRQRQIHARFALVIAERTRLAREIHDTLAQGFFGICSQLDALSVKLDDPDSARRELNLARRMARHSLAEARRSVMGLRTAALDDRSLSDALASSARQWTEGSPIEVRLRLAPTEILGAEIEQNVLRIAQEAVTNSIKHAQPRSIGIDLDRQASHLVLRVTDDGCGFDAAQSSSDKEGHFGLLGMRERAQRIGAEFQVLSYPGQGTTVEVTVPV
jgi:signal transduction histidine kinase/ligand-binding sensor domain-containing protein